jgi:hypothetical protein
LLRPSIKVRSSSRKLSAGPESESLISSEKCCRVSFKHPPCRHSARFSSAAQGGSLLSCHEKGAPLGPEEVPLSPAAGRRLVIAKASQSGPIVTLWHASRVGRLKHFKRF